MLDYCTKLTRRPSDCREADVARLRKVGFEDAEILDIVQIASYFNYINRVADALGCDPEPSMTADAQVPKFRAPAVRRTPRPPAAKPAAPPAAKPAPLAKPAPPAKPAPAPKLAPVAKPTPPPASPPSPPPAPPAVRVPAVPEPPPVQIDDSWYERPANVPEEVAAGGVVVRVEGAHVYVALTREGTSPGYVLPKGKTRPNEDEPVAARREILEEIGIKELRFLADLGTRERLSYSKDHWKKTHYFLFITTQRAGKPTDKHHGPVEWFPLDDLPPMFWREQQELLENSLQQIRWLVSQQP